MIADPAIDHPADLATAEVGATAMVGTGGAYALFLLPALSPAFRCDEGNVGMSSGRLG